MKILKIKYCNETFKNCFYLKDKIEELQYSCGHPEIIKKSKDSKEYKGW